MQKSNSFKIKGETFLMFIILTVIGTSVRLSEIYPNVYMYICSVSMIYLTPLMEGISNLN